MIELPTDKMENDEKFEDQKLEKELEDLIKLKNRFLLSFPSDEKRKGEVIFDYVLQQLNEMTLKGEIDFVSYKIAITKAVTGLFKLIYFRLTDLDSEDPNTEILKADIMFSASRNFLILAFSRASGKDRELIIKEIEAKRPLMVGK